MSILLKAEVSLRVHWLPALWTSRPPLRDELGAMLGQATPLLAAKGEPGGFKLFALCTAAKLLDDDHQQIACLVIAQSDLSSPERLFDRLLKLHTCDPDQVIGRAQQRILFGQALE